MAQSELRKLAADLADPIPDLPKSQMRSSAEAVQIVAVSVDVILSVLAMLISTWAYSGEIQLTGEIAEEGFQVGLLAALVFVGFFSMRGGYGMDALCNRRRQLVAVVHAWLFTFLTLAWVAFLMKVTSGYSRGAVTIYFVLGGLSLTAAHIAGSAWLKARLASRTLSLRRVAVVTVCERGALQGVRGRLSQQGVEIVSLTTISPNSVSWPRFPMVCCDAFDDVRRALSSEKLDAVFLFVPWRDVRQVAELRAALSPLPVPLYLFADPEVEPVLDRPRLTIGRLQGFELQRAPLNKFDRGLKRGLDIVVAVSALILLSPLLLLTSIAVLAQSGRPILFRQNRKGFGGRPFEILKFRSMIVQENGAEVKQAEKNDARVTALGRLLRKTSIDELPQLLNVLRGDMSIVGPRPHAVAHDNFYDRIIAPYAFRHHVKPGITGWAQVNGFRGETRRVEQMAARVEHDIWYINNWSIWLDIVILLRTVVVFAGQRNAY